MFYRSSSKELDPINTTRASGIKYWPVTSPLKITQVIYCCSLTNVHRKCQQQFHNKTAGDVLLGKPRSHSEEGESIKILMDAK